MKSGPTGRGLRKQVTDAKEGPLDLGKKRKVRKAHLGEASGEKPGYAP